MRAARKPERFTHPGAAFGLSPATLHARATEPTAAAALAAAPGDGRAPGDGAPDGFVIPGELDHTALLGAEPATLADGTPLAPQLLARLTCSGALHRVIFGTDSEILDVGREE
ncbi:hypothetical protein [Georgenia soli]|uniref:hypothetical protein n=1 Tax=Georgenia soli TaxID=638953 RepID=UPI000BF3EC61|nr:hypothetical protein [Georgenia soli]